MKVAYLNNSSINYKNKPLFIKKEARLAFCGKKDDNSLEYLDYIGKINTFKSNGANSLGKRDYTGFKIKIEPFYTKEDIRQIAALSKVYRSLDEKEKGFYENDFYTLSNLKKQNGDFIFSAKSAILDRKLIVYDADRELITRLLDIKYSNPNAKMFIDEAICGFINNKITRCELKQFIYAIESNAKNAAETPKCKPETFFIDIEGYGKDQNWADYMASSANAAAFRIKTGDDFDSVLREIADDASYFDFNNIKKEKDIEKAVLSGKLRIYSKNLMFSKTPFKLNGSKYSAYAKKFIEKTSPKKDDETILYFAPKVPKKFEGIAPTTIRWGTKENLGELIHKKEGILPTFVYCADIYNSLCEKFLDKQIAKEDEEEINKKIATMHWLLAQAMPYERGSDAIINTFIKAMYSALGFETYKAKSGVSFDLEAYKSELDEYIQNYQDLYSKKPKYIF